MAYDDLVAAVPWLDALPTVGLAFATLAFIAYPIVLNIYVVQTGQAATRKQNQLQRSKEEECDKPKAKNELSATFWHSPVTNLLEKCSEDWAAFLAAILVWVNMCSLPLLLTLGAPRYRALFPASWFIEHPDLSQRTYGLLNMAGPGALSERLLGLVLGILAVIVGQAGVVVYHFLRRRGLLGKETRVQVKEAAYDFKEGLQSYLAQPGGFALIGGYLASTWLLGMMPASYYGFAGVIDFRHVLAQLLVQDFLQCVMHLGEHRISMWIYRLSHKPHHRFTNPRLFDAFDGSIGDTTLMILIPFLGTARLVPANVWSYMAFGSIYSCWLSLIHSEFINPWDAIFRKLGFGTAADHHVHHKLFYFNFGHLFMYWDKLFGTYKDPRAMVGKIFNEGV
jgi:sterol desaturase/sphingolipid hydroxylase (fatty acid hydroxylase superfamily)